MSSRLTSESRIYADKAKELNQQVSLFFTGGFLPFIAMIVPCSL